MKVAVDSGIYYGMLTDTIGSELLSVRFDQLQVGLSFNTLERIKSGAFTPHHIRVDGGIVSISDKLFKRTLFGGYKPFKVIALHKEHRKITIILNNGKCDANIIIKPRYKRERMELYQASGYTVDSSQ